MGQDVRMGEELNELNLKQFLLENQIIINTNEELKISQFSNGYSNLTYQIDISGRSFVLRRPPFGAIRRGHDMSREYKVLSQLYRQFPKSPRAFAYTEDIDVIGSSFYIMEKVKGIILTHKEATKRNIQAEEFPIIAESWMNTFVELHNTDYTKAGLEDLGKPHGYVERQVSNWSKQYLKAATQEIPEAHKVMQWLEENQPKEYRHALIHNDFKYDNVVFKDDSWKEINAVLDWEMCTLGDPLMDLGTSLAYWSMDSDSDFITKGWPSPTAIPGNPGRDKLVQMYAEKSGQNVDNIVFYYAFGLFKVAVIVQQIYYRYSKGLTTDEKFAHLDRAAQLFCLIAWQAIQKNRIERLF